MTNQLLKSWSGRGTSRHRRRWPLITVLLVAIGLLAVSFAASAAPAPLEDATGKMALASVALPPRTDSAVSAALQADPQLGFSPNTSLIGVGETYCIDVTIADANDLGAYEWDVTYDDTLINIGDASLGAFLGSSGRDAVGLEDTRLADPAPAPDLDTGRIGYGAFSCPTADCFSDPGGVPSPIAGPNGDGVLATLEVTGLAAGTSALNFENSLIVDTNAAEQTTATPAAGSVQVAQFRPDDLFVLKAADLLHHYDAPVGMNASARYFGSAGLASDIEFVIGGDFDGDGEDELGVLGKISGVKAFLVYAPPTTCGEAATLEAFNLFHIPTGNILQMAAADINGDGKDEVVRLLDFGVFKAVLVNDAPTVPNGNAPLVAFQTPATVRFIGSGTTGLMTGVDYNGDGTDEIAIIKYFGSARFLFVYSAPDVPNDLAGDLYAYQYTLLGNPPGWANPPIAMSGADYNGDGTDEMAIVKDFGGTHILFIYQTPTGPWGAAPLQSWSSTPTSSNDVAFLAGVRP